MAVDGTHLPFRPERASTAPDFRNYKVFIISSFLLESGFIMLFLTHTPMYIQGWHSILTAAFVNSFHLFVDADIGAGVMYECDTCTYFCNLYYCELTPTPVSVSRSWSQR